MSHFLSSVLFLNFLILQALGNVTYTYNNNVVCLNLLDVAMDIITKAKPDQPVCPPSSESLISKPIDYEEVSLVSKPVDCEEVLRQGKTVTGVYTIWPRSRVLEDNPLQVYCDMDTDGGGWTVLQRRGDFGKAMDYFYRDWASYKKGFGDIGKDFWLGNDNIFALTSQRLTSIRFDLKAIDGKKKYALYEKFWIDDEEHMYTLHIMYYTGNAGDAMEYYDNAKFSSKDRDNDKMLGFCAQKFKGGWWYNACSHSNLNGLYWKGNHESSDGVNWISWRHYNESLVFTEIKIRSSNFKKADVSN